ncbi:MAG: hypothetical protein KF830_05070 [Planctomycetes bacterium]|nr:hypothetical protein [Planctomycetota bacterium]
MHQPTLAILLAVLPWLLSSLRAQDYGREQFRAEFAKAVEIGDDRMADRAVKRAPLQAVLLFEEWFRQQRRAGQGPDERLEPLRRSWARVSEKGPTLDKLERWLDSVDDSALTLLDRSRDNGYKVWGNYVDHAAKQGTKQDYEQVVARFVELARTAESFGHMIEVAELWNLAAVVGSKMPGRTSVERRDALFALEQFLQARESWGFTFDEHYLRNREFAKSEKHAIEAAEKEEQKRKDAGFGADAKGIDSLVVPGKQDTLPLHFEALSAWDAELDYSAKGGPVPAFWWMASTAAPGSNRKLDWFRRGDLYLVRAGASKFGVSIDPNDPKRLQEVDVSPKARPTSFWLDADHKQPYAMFFWVGSDRERVGEAECNLQVADRVGNVYYRSAASWKVVHGNETIVLYDDNASGRPADGDPFEVPFRSPMVGEHDGEGTVVPLLDSMRIGKGPRVPFSEFVHLASGWVHLRRGTGDEVVVRPLHPDFVPMGKVKLAWNGPKPTAPVQLVVQGSGDFQTACFDLAGGKEVEVPAGTYSVIFGRVVAGKGARVQAANLYRGSSPTFEVQAGKTFELKMGAPFALDFTRRGDENASIDALKILVREASGCVFTEFHGMSLAPAVLAAKGEDGKGAKVVGEFVRFTDPELVNKAASRHQNVGTLVACFPMPEGYRDGEMVLSVKLPGEGMKLGLAMKKHALFGELKSRFH